MIPGTEEQTKPIASKKKEIKIRVKSMKQKQKTVEKISKTKTWLIENIN